MTVKLALTIPKPKSLGADMPAPTVRELLQADPSLVDRAVCETDLSTVQLIPYIALVDTTDTEPKYFVYTRGKASGEGRLIGKCSIGLGGHIEETLDISGNPQSHIARFAHLIAECAVRELEEEVGLNFSLSDFVNGILPNFYPRTPDDVKLLSDATVLYTPLTEVDAVHVAITFAVRVTADEIKDLEKDVITRGQWMTYSEIIDGEAAKDPIVLETWSAVFLAQLNNKLVNT